VGLCPTEEEGNRGCPISRALLAREVGISGKLEALNPFLEDMREPKEGSR
jgi:hypothetical protein